jgi:hypothetical protein
MLLITELAERPAQKLPDRQEIQMSTMLHRELMGSRELELASVARRAVRANEAKLAIGDNVHRRHTSPARAARVLAVAVVLVSLALAGTAFARTGRMSLVRSTGMHSLVRQTRSTGTNSLVRKTSRTLVARSTGMHSVARNMHLIRH